MIFGRGGGALWATEASPRCFLQGRRSVVEERLCLEVVPSVVDVNWSLDLQHREGLL